MPQFKRPLTTEKRGAFAGDIDRIWRRRHLAVVDMHHDPRVIPSGEMATVFNHLANGDEDPGSEGGAPPTTLR
jgi:hypothetical protein